MNSIKILINKIKLNDIYMYINIYKKKKKKKKKKKHYIDKLIPLLEDCEDLDSTEDLYRLSAIMKAISKSYLITIYKYIYIYK